MKDLYTRNSGDFGGSTIGFVVDRLGGRHLGGLMSIPALLFSAFQPFLRI
jgi:hypothetical protein